MYIYICICTYIYIFIYIYRYKSTSIYLYLSISIFIHVCLSISIYLSIYLSICKHIYTAKQAAHIKGNHSEARRLLGETCAQLEDWRCTLHPTPCHQGPGSRVESSGLRVQGFGCSVEGSASWARRALSSRITLNPVGCGVWGVTCGAKGVARGLPVHPSPFTLAPQLYTRIPKP